MAVFDFETFPTLETPRLILREMTINDAEAVFRIRSDYQVTIYNTGEPYTRIDQALSLIEGVREGFQAGLELRWGVTLKPSPTVIGMCGYNYWMRDHFRASIGYDMARAYWGKGLMPEALHAILHFGFRRMALNRVEADVLAENAASIRVLEKLGFLREGTLRERDFERGAFRDLLLYGLLRRDYQPPSWLSPI
jgi:ribosomal-protein-alanine N-acetyltransferase